VEPAIETITTLPNATEIEDAIRTTPRNVALTPEIKLAVERLLMPVEGAIAAARGLAGAGAGRYEISFRDVAIAPNRPYAEDVRRVSRLLYLDASRLSEAGKIDEALTSARGLIGVAQSVGDEPSEYSQLFRLHQRRAGLAAILRALGQGEASDAALAAVQDDLAREAAHDLLLCAMRAQRAAYFDTLGKMAEGSYVRFAQAPGPGGSSADGSQARADPIAQFLYVRAYLRYNQAFALSLLNQAVEGAKRRPFEPGWSEHWTAYEEGLEDAGPIQRRLGAIAYTILPINSSMVWMSYESQALMGALRVLLAAERCRLARGHWPESLDDLVPTYLPRVPRGPYSDAPLRFVRKPDGVVAYAVGLRGRDNGGRLRLNFERTRDPEYDVGAQLWNPDLRRRREHGVTSR
jgi:hypothetical protein